MTKSRRRFPPPWIVEEYRGISYIVRDANDFPVAYVYFESEPGRRAAANLMTKDEARKIAAEPDMKSVRRMAMNSASKTTLCPDYNGQGRHRRDPETGYERVCDRCKGSGVVIVREMPQAPISRKVPDRR